MNNLNPSAHRDATQAVAINRKEALITIEITPLSGGYYAACLDGRALTKQSLTPFLTAARVLLREGVAPSTPIQMKHKGNDIVSLRSTVGGAARLTVRETATEGPMFVRYAPPSLKGVAQDRANPIANIQAAAS